MDSSNVSQNNCSSRWSRGTATKATGCVGADRAAQARSSEVLPLPAGAEITVTFRATARSSAATSRPRSTRRVPLVPQSDACSAVTTLLSAAGLYCAPSITWPRRIPLAIPGHINRQHLASTPHYFPGEACTRCEYPESVDYHDKRKTLGRWHRVHPS